ncbi:hypothetical protein M231_02863 [Tremella mesenterica]|uniref:Glycosyltransferase 61 catalytic domain-containing protein n=1 Tax=Tremella mesenterica TaxID=5217 RepID=A0A4Q1BPH5_TREME|nr:hypothetical protein M231_02863 [Tremella mesenterica]
MIIILMILVAELFLGAWRVLASAGEDELPTRLMFRTAPDDWRDRTGLTPWFQQAVLPSTSVEERTIFEDRSSSSLTFIYDRMVIVDRWAAHRHGQETKWWNKATADLPLLPVAKNWMSPLRNAMKNLVIADGCDMSRKWSDRPVVTYINRQMTGRRLTEEDAEGLLRSMNRLAQEGVIEFTDAKMETMSRTEQFCLALRTDIMIGVHGNGLTHQLWMKPDSGVLEFMMGPGFARDYALVAELMGHEYYAIHDDHVFPPDQWRREDGWAVDQGPGFHGSNVRVNGEFIAEMVRDMAAARRGVTEPL